MSWRRSKLRDQFGDHEDQQTDEAADQGPVDADILQILADLQFEPVDERGAVPILHDIGDIGADLGAPRQQDAKDDEADLAIEPRPARRIIPKPSTEPA